MLGTLYGSTQKQVLKKLEMIYKLLGIAKTQHQAMCYLNLTTHQPSLKALIHHLPKHLGKILGKLYGSMQKQVLKKLAMTYKTLGMTTSTALKMAQSKQAITLTMLLKKQQKPSKTTGTAPKTV